FSSRRRHTRFSRDWSSDVCSSDLDGTEMTSEEWHQQFARCLGVYLSGQSMTETDERGRLLEDDDFIILFNAHHEELPFVIPHFEAPSRWRVLIDSSQPDSGEWTAFESGAQYPC